MPEPTSADGIAHGLVGEACRVIAPFVDAAGRAHAVGDRWRVLRAEYNAAENTLELIVSSGDGERPIPLAWDGGPQQEVIEHVDRYLSPDGEVDAPPALPDAIASWGRTLGRMWRRRFPNKRAGGRSD